MSTRMVPAAAVFAAGVVLSRGLSNRWLFFGAAIVFVIGVWATCWAWMTPVVSIADRVLIWRDVPQSRGKAICLDEVVKWHYSEEERRIGFELASGDMKTVRVGRMARDDVNSLIALLSRELNQ